MAVDEGRAWALKTFGADGVLVREEIPSIIRNCHTSMANSQAESGMKHTGVYGNIWRKCLDEFVHILGKFPSAEIISRRGYKLVSFNGVILFPWRYARELSTDITSKPFAISETRISLFELEYDTGQQRLDIDFEHPELTQEEQELLEAEYAALQEELSSFHRVVIVPYASNPSALHSINWGEATMDSAGYLNFKTLESLLNIEPSSLADLSPAENESFSDGPIPRPQLGARVEEEEYDARG